MTLSRWKIMACILVLSVGGLAVCVGQSNNQPQKAETKPPQPARPMVAAEPRQTRRALERSGYAAAPPRNCRIDPGCTGTGVRTRTPHAAAACNTPKPDRRSGSHAGRHTDNSSCP